jgi:hypothetical protein
MNSLFPLMQNYNKKELKLNKLLNREINLKK